MQSAMAAQVAVAAAQEANSGKFNFYLFRLIDCLLSYLMS